MDVPTGKGVFSSPVIDAEGNVYVGSADHTFYALDRDGTLRWKFATGEMIDSSALLDDRGRVYFGSGDGHVYALERATGALWKFRADTAAEVEARYGIESSTWTGSRATWPCFPTGRCSRPTTTS